MPSSGVGNSTSGEFRAPDALRPVFYGAGGSAVESIVQQQLALMQAQLALLSGQALAAPTLVRVQPAAQPDPAPKLPEASSYYEAEVRAKPAVDNSKTAFGASARINLKSGEQLSSAQQAHLDAILADYPARHRQSKNKTEENRSRLADPRVVSGFRPLIKELVFPIVVDRSKGSRLWDIDGNEYIDLTCGFGSNFLGHSPDIVVEAVKRQLDRGYEIGPQHPMVYELAELVTEFTGLPRVAFCNTGSEAVLGAMRLARTVTGRDLVVLFNGDYHGIIDEVIVRGGKNGKSIPASPGIPASHVENVLVLEYGDSKSLDIIRERASEIAAVMVEPVQSRRPDLQPREFLHACRKLCDASGAALIFDEVITGFRVAPGGAQEHFGVKADIGTYGKIVGGGMPIGAIAGIPRFMDALDGGAWKFGDASIPQVGVTYFAGTFVRHPIALAAGLAVMKHLKAQGRSAYDAVNARTGGMVARINAYLKECHAPVKLKHFGSLFKVTYTEEQTYGELLYVLLRNKGIHLWDNRPCFLTLAHSEADVEVIVAAFQEAVTELQASGLLPGGAPLTETSVRPGLTTNPPVPGARLGRDPEGNPAWYVADPSRPGRYVKV